MTSPSVTVRLATPHDMHRVGALGAQLVAVHHAFDAMRFLPADDATPTDYAEFLHDQLRDESSIILVAQIDDRIVGYSFSRVEGYDYLKLRGPAGLIHDLMVDPDVRGAGIGIALLDATIAALRTRGVPRVVLATAEHNTDAQRLFARAGFRRTMVEMTRELKELQPEA